MTCGFWSKAGALIPGLWSCALLAAAPVPEIYLDFAAAVPSGTVYAGVPVELIATSKVTSLEGMTRDAFLEQRGFNPRVKWHAQKGSVTNATAGSVLGANTLPPNGLVFVNRCTYTPPSLPGEYTISVVPEADPSKLTSLRITVEERVLKIHPSAVTLAPGQELSFAAVFQGPASAALSWSTTGGSLSPQGRYKAPVAPGIHTVTVRHGPSGKQATALVTVTNPFRIQPASLELVPGQSVQFRCAEEQETVTWSIQGQDGGTIAQDGTYTAPRKPGIYTILATSPSRRALATARVAPLTLSLTPPETTLGTGQRIQFRADLSHGTCLWSASEGEITENGLYHAPLKFGTYQVFATSALDPEVRAIAVVHVDVFGLMQVVPEDLTLHIGQTQQFTVTGLTGDAATAWVVQPAAAGTITENGLFTAGSTPGPCSIMALREDEVSTASVLLIDTRILPDSAVVKPGGSLQFTVQGFPKNAPVSWFLDPAASGTLSGDGLFTAGNRPGEYLVSASAGGAEASASLRILAARITPEEIILGPGQSTRFTCDVFDTPGQVLTWRLLGNQPGAFLGQDGLYKAPTRQGVYRISASDSAGNTAQAKVTVGPPSGLLVAPELHLEQDGIYTVWVRLQASNGRTVDGSFTGELQQGLAYPEIAFPARKLLADLNVDGPYAITRIWVMGTFEAETIIFDARENLGSTVGFSLEEAARAWIRIGDITDIKGQASEGGGLLEALSVTIPVELISDGEYVIQASLTMEDGTEIDTWKETRTRTGGMNPVVLTFDGRKIHARGSTGPLSITAFSVEGPVARSRDFQGSIKGFDFRMFKP